MSMPNVCCAIGCHNHSKKQVCRDRDVSFHKFPLKNKALLKHWLQQIKRADFIPNKSTKICSDHFEKHCFSKDTNTRFHRLQEDSVPTIFLFPDKSILCRKNQQPKPSESPLESVQSSSMSNCFVPECDHCTISSSLLNSSVCIFYKFPKTNILRDLWIKNIGSAETPDENSRVCSCHFVNGLKKNRPTIFANRPATSPSPLSPRTDIKMKLITTPKKDDEKGESATEKDNDTSASTQSILMTEGQKTRMRTFTPKSALQTNVRKQEIKTRQNPTLSTMEVEEENSSSSEEEEQKIDETKFIVINGAIRRRRPSDDPPVTKINNKYYVNVALEKELEGMLDDYMVMLKKQKLIK